MATYSISLADLQALSSPFHRELCEKSMKGLIDRYGIKGKSVFSIGSGNGFEEWWFKAYGECRLTLNDIDLGHCLDNLKHSNEGIDYHIEDIATLVPRLPQGSFDLLYVSGFHPDELRREAITHRFNHRWPVGEQPYIEVMMEACRLIKPQGLAIFQHYRGGVNVESNPQYLESIRRQFKANGMELLETYCFRRSPSHLLVVGFKGEQKEALAFADKLKDRLRITSFHGRFHDEKIKNDVAKVYDVIQGHLNPWKRDNAVIRLGERLNNSFKKRLRLYYAK